MKRIINRSLSITQDCFETTHLAEGILLDTAYVIIALMGKAPFPKTGGTSENMNLENFP